jgi:SAM-dependent methyltransferase
MDRTEQQAYCPVCEKRQQGFEDFNGRKNARCTHCGSLERHRSVWIYFKKKTDLFKNINRRFLHIAPESCFADKFSSLFRSDYLTADLNMKTAMLKMDIMDIPYPAASFEIIYNSHVLEHVEDYVRALREFYRVLTPAGWMILLVPARTEDKTYRFAQTSPSGHIWKFGCDLIDKLEGIGFQVRLRTVSEIAAPQEIRSMALKKNQEIFHCYK